MAAVRYLLVTAEEINEQMDRQTDRQMHIAVT